MLSGILLIDKPEGITSAKALAKVKHKLGIEKIGHAGTLDPMATGLLVCLLGRATKCARFAEDGQKTYSGRILFGRTTDTDDVTGTTIATSTAIPNFTAIIGASKSFLGDISQLPPQYSALKVNGERAYDRARRGETTELKFRDVKIGSFELSETERVEEVSFRIACSPGTYIRSIARDLGEKLGCGGSLSSLRRDGSHAFSVLNAKKIEEVELSDVIAWDSLFPNTPRISIQDVASQKIYGGDQRDLNLILSGRANELSTSATALYVSESNSQCLGVLVKENDHWIVGVNI